MTRYRKKTHRNIIQFLEEVGPSTLREIADSLGREERVIRNYLQHFREDFEVLRQAGGARWVTRRKVRHEGNQIWIE